MEFRKYDLNQAQDMDRVMVHPERCNTACVGTPFVAKTMVAIRWSDGVLTLFNKEEDHCLIHKPVYLLEDKPVYVGDTVYCRHGPVRVEHDHAPDSPPEVLDPTHWSFKPKPKPKTLNINGFEVPYPETEEPKVGTFYWTVSLDGARRLTWDGDETDLEYLHEGRVHLIEENAQSHTNALLSFFKD